MTQIAIFLVTVFGVAWTLCLVLRAIAPEGGLWILLWLLPTVWSPTIAALLLIRSAEGRGAVRREIKARLTCRRGSARWLLVAGVVPALAIAIAVLTARSAGDAGPFIPSGAIPVMVVVQLLTGAVGEELGWRGFLLPRLGRRLGEMTAAWVMAILWSLWHVAGFFVPGMPHQIMPPMSTLIFIAFFGVFLAFVFNRAGESVIATIVAHVSLNIATGIGGVQLSSVVFWRTLAAIFGALALLIVIASRAAQRRRAAEASPRDVHGYTDRSIS